VPTTSTRSVQDLIVSQPDLRVVHDARPAADQLTVSVETVLTGRDADAAWATYRDSLAPLAGVAAMKQMMSEAELRTAVADPAILKYVGRDEVGDVVAILTLTTDLKTENISDAFYRDRYPEHYAAGRLHYLGFLVVRPEAQARGLIMVLVRTMAENLAREGGVVAFDVCGYNDETFAFARLCRLVGARTRPTDLVTLDVQTYYALEVPPIPS
jgi:GNAT superfamily N-acetyltransferase